MLDSDTLVSSVRFTQKHSNCTLTLTQTNSIWLICWWQPSWIVLSWIQQFCTKLWLKPIQSDSNSFFLTQLDDGSHLEILPCWIQTPCYVLSRFTQKHSHCTLTLTQPNSIWLKLIHFHLTSCLQPSWILPSSNQPFCTKLYTQPNSNWLKLHDGILIFNSAMMDSDTAILNSNTLLSSLRFTQNHSHFTLTLTQTNSNWLKLIHSDSSWWWQPSWIPPSWIQPFWTKKILHSFRLTQLDDMRHLEFCHIGFNHFEQKNTLTHSIWLILMMAANLNSTFLESAILKKNFSHSFWLNLMMAGILNFCHHEFRHCHLGFSHLSYLPLKLTHTCQDWFPPLCT